MRRRLSSLTGLGKSHGNKTIVVFGVTGNQGGSTARALLNEGWKVVGITRNTESRSAKEMASLGVTLHQGDLDDPSTYAAALKGAYGAFLTLDFWAHYRGNNSDEAQAAEEAQGYKAAQALADAKLHHVVYSSLESTLPTLKLPHFDSKANVTKRLRELGVPTTEVRAAYYYSNVLTQLQSDPKGEGFVLDHPLPDNVSVGGCFAVEQIGLWVAKAFADPSTVGKVIDTGGQYMTVREIADAVAKFTGRPCRTNEVTDEQFKADKETDREWYANCQAFYQGLIKRDVDAARKLVPEAWDWQEWAKQDSRMKSLLAAAVM